MRSATLAVALAFLATTTLAYDEFAHQAFEDEVPLPLGVNVNVSSLRHHAGECSVGVACGAAAGWLVRKMQGAAMTLGVVGGIATAAGLHLEWISPEQVRVLGVGASRVVRSKFQQAASHADVDGDGEITVEDSRVAYSKVVPHVRRHPALTGGLVGGFIAGYSGFR